MLPTFQRGPIYETLQDCKSATVPVIPRAMSNFNSLFLVLMLTVALLPITLSEPEDPIQALLKRLNSKRSSPSVQEAAAEAVLERLLPGYVSSFEFKIISDVPSFFQNFFPYSCFTLFSP